MKHFLFECSSPFYIYTVWADLGQEERCEALLKELKGFGSVCRNVYESKTSGLWILPHAVGVTDKIISLKYRQKDVFYQFKFLWKPRNFERFYFHLFNI